MSRKRFLCLDCSIDTGDAREHYFVYDEVWLSVVESKQGMLCVGCLEKRLGRTLIPTDFPHVSINNPKFNEMSMRLLNRIQPEEAECLRRC